MGLALCRAIHEAVAEENGDLIHGIMIALVE
jgi:hypothetical protein